jgi:hypothetical protein
MGHLFVCRAKLTHPQLRACYLDSQGCIVSFLWFCARPPPLPLNLGNANHNGRAPPLSLTDRSPELATQDAIGAVRPDGEMPLLGTQQSFVERVSTMVSRPTCEPQVPRTFSLLASACTPRDECFVAPVPPSRLPFDTIPPPQRDRHMRRAR